MSGTNRAHITLKAMRAPDISCKLKNQHLIKQKTIGDLKMINRRKAATLILGGLSLVTLAGSLVPPARERKSERSTESRKRLMNLPHQCRSLEGVSPHAAPAALGPTVPAG